MELVTLARAGSQELKTILKNRLTDIRERREDLAKRYKKKESISSEEQASLAVPIIQEALQQLSKLGLKENNLEREKKRGMISSIVSP